jgi:hypothetical protein
MHLSGSEVSCDPNHMIEGPNAMRCVAVPVGMLFIGLLSWADEAPPAPLTLREVMNRQAASLAKVKAAEKALRDAKTNVERTAAAEDLGEARTASSKELAMLRGTAIRLSGEAISVQPAPQAGDILIKLHVGNDVLVDLRAAKADWPGLKRRDKIRVIGKIQGMYPPGLPNIWEAKPDVAPDKKDKPEKKEKAVPKGV